MGQLGLIRVTAEDNQRHEQWVGLISQFHYLGYQPLVGAQMRYLIVSKKGILGAVGFSAAARRVRARDEWIGWDEHERAEHLQRVVCNSRFLIAPWVKVPNLASKVLSMCVKRLGVDWEGAYGYRPVLLETYIEKGRFKGVCYRAANWRYVGQTQGRGRADYAHEQGVSVKDIYVYPLVKSVTRALGLEPKVGVEEHFQDWVDEEFQYTEFADQRLNQRVRIIARDFARHSGSNVPQACQSRAKAKAAYRFFSNKKVTAKGMFFSHKQRTLDRIKAHRVVLAVQDTTTLNFQGQGQMEGVGYIDNRKVKGVLVHDTMAYSADGIPVGLIDVNLWAREEGQFGKKYRRRQRKIEDKESYKWIRSYEAVAEAQRQAPDTQIISICDREADVHEFFSRVMQEANGPDVLVRAAYNRKLEGEEAGLFETLRRQPCQGERQIEIPRRPGRKKRTARLEIRYAKVALKASKPAGKHAGIDLWAVLAEETKAPESELPLSWMLLTTIAVEGFEQALQIVDYYRVRWEIEVFHKIIKSGCRIEDRQLSSVNRLENCLSLDMVVAWRVAYMKKQSRKKPHTSCETILEPHEWKALCCYVNKTPRPPEEAPTLREATRMIAGLGGFLGRKCDGEPGDITIWRGLQTLAPIAQAFLIFYNIVTSTGYG